MGNKLFTAFLVCSCAVLAVLVVLLARENRRLKGDLARLTATPAVSLAPGEAVGPLPLVDAEGKASELAPADGSATLVLMLSGACGFCEQALPGWNDLAERAAAWGVRTVAVQIDGPPGGKPEYRSVLRTPLYLVPDAGATWLRQIPSVPAVILLDGAGVVRDVSVAELTPQRIDALERAAAGVANGE